MRRKSMQGGRQNHGHNGGGQRRGGGGGGGGGYNNNRPRKNYPQLREKYLNQARDALSSGDRVMAEYYFQHADHCYRMMLEEGYRPHQQQPQDANADAAPQENASAEQAPVSAAEDMPDANALPSFLTMGYTANAQASNTEQAAANPQAAQWEEN